MNNLLHGFSSFLQYPPYDSLKDIMLTNGTMLLHNKQICYYYNK